MPRFALITLIAALFCGAVAAQPEPARPPAKAAASRYACPMKCEGDKNYPEPGKCPVCKMKLRAIAAPAYSLKLASAGGPPKGNEPTMFNLEVLDSSGAPVAAFDPIDGKQLHLYIMLRDLALLVHSTPERRESGGFRFETALPPGEYVAYAHFQPAGGQEQVATSSLSVSGKAANLRAMGVDADRPRNVDGCTVTLDGSQSIHAEQEATLTLRISSQGKPADHLEPYLGKPAHAVAVSQDRKHLIVPRIVPDATHEADVVFAATFPEPGLYRVWFEFQRAGKVSTAAFNIEVLPPRK